MSTNPTAGQTTTIVPVGRWNVDPSHSSVEFGIRHLMITTVRGRFREFDGFFQAAESGRVHAEAHIKAASIDTGEETRDEHLRSGDFFDVEHYPEITFVSDDVEPLGDGRFRVVGVLTIRGIAREQELEATAGGLNTDPWGSERVGVTLRGELRPTDFGVDWNQALEGGGKLLGEKVEVTADISAVKSE
jgi:polyisoprenoid-binding protein YceI